MSKKKTPARDPKTGKFLTKAQKAARSRARKGGGKGKSRPRAAREAAPAVASERKTPKRPRKSGGGGHGKSAHARALAAQKGARTRARHEREEKKKREAAARKRRRTMSARDQLTQQRQGKLSKSWRTGRYPAGHPRAGQFKSVSPGSGSVSEHAFLAAAENPLGFPEWLIGGGSIALGALGLGVIDRIASTVPLTDTNTKDANGNEVYTDPGGATGGPYAGMTNASAYAAPMGMKRWLIAAVAVTVPIGGGMALAYFSHDGWPKATAFLNFTGMGAFGYVIVKSGGDLLARLLRGKAFGQRIFDVEIRAQALKAGSTYTGPTPPSTGLGRNLACGGDCGCGPCRAKRAKAPPAPEFPPAHAGGGNPPPEAKKEPPAPAPAPKQVAEPHRQPVYMGKPSRFPMNILGSSELQ